jgi:stage III sporulation protein AG
VIKTVKPHVRGVLVVAKGAEQPRIQAIIMESVQRVLEVPPHRIGIQAKNVTDKK